MKRRVFLKRAAVSLAGVALAPRFSTLAAGSDLPSAGRLPRWRGFNLLEKFVARSSGNPSFREADFAWLQEWGFDFVRLPMSYLCWADGDPKNWLTLREENLKDIDRAVDLGKQHGVHVNLNFHRAPGYCVNPPKEPLDLWKDQQALDACAFHWAAFARRYRGIPNDRLSFDLLNEPPDIPRDDYARVVKHLVAAIREEDPDRLIIADGLKWGREPMPEFVPLRIAQSTRGYDPMRISHWKANWVRGSDQWPEPTWPLKENEKSTWDKERLRRERIRPWQELARKGSGVHVGEWGCFNRTPHSVALAWMKDQLELWKDAGWGWAMWNLRGAFGPVDSGRADVSYDDFHGHKLDAAMLELMRAY